MTHLLLLLLPTLCRAIILAKLQLNKNDYKIGIPSASCANRRPLPLVISSPCVSAIIKTILARQDNIEMGLKMLSKWAELVEYVGRTIDLAK